MIKQQQIYCKDCTKERIVAIYESNTLKNILQ